MAASAEVRRIVIENCAIATVDAGDTEYASGHVVVAGTTASSRSARAGPRRAWRTSYAVSTPRATS